jgi:hypothetical protein
MEYMLIDPLRHGRDATRSVCARNREMPVSPILAS